MLNLSHSETVKFSSCPESSEIHRPRKIFRKKDVNALANILLEQTSTLLREFYYARLIRTFSCGVFAIFHETIVARMTRH